ncbi:hypothetical protein H5410_022730 [Solanum commersonii]|uniref:Uncharacterized protein n=1 Tax=Solanum commersonii TaxID=4109 RepID=A0A9J5ZEW3_SOLCO|nr:hypothetical protein H5410_022730 [Solanum commersonii]
MVMDMSSPGLLHSWSSSRFLDEVSSLLHQVSTDVSGYLNVPSLNCGSNLTKGLNNLSDSNKLISYEMTENVTLKAQLGATGVPRQVPPPPGMYPHSLLMDVIIQPCMIKPQGSQVPLVPIPKLKPQAVVPMSKSSKKVEKKKR